MHRLTFFLIYFVSTTSTIGRCQETFAEKPAPSLAPTARIQLPGLQGNNQILLPNGWSLAPEGEQIAMGDFPSNIQVSPDGKYAAVLHCGYGDHEIRIVELGVQKVISSAIVDQAFYGLVFMNDGRELAVSGGEDERIYLFPFQDGYLGKPSSLKVAEPDDKFVVAGIEPHNASGELIVCGLLANEVRVFSIADGKQRFNVELGDDAFPFTARADSRRDIAYVSLWGKSSVAVVDLIEGKVVRELQTDSHPTEMELLDDGKWLLVACSDQNSVVVIDTATGKQREVIKTSLYPQASNGSTPASLAVSPDGNVLLAANSDNNNLAVFDIGRRGQSTSLGFIPVGWYPTSVRFSGDGQSILVANGKGMSSRANVNGPNPNLSAPATMREYIGSLFKGTLSVIDNPGPAEMARMTRTAFQCSPLIADQSTSIRPASTDNPIPAEVGQPSPIKHCVYIIKENRTYDQVFGDLPQGNGDPSLCIFPRRVTPNHHALAEQFVLLDNFYVESEVSADGHEWTMAAYANDFVEKTWPLTYRGGRKKLSYPSEGKFVIAQPSSGYIWDRCLEAGISYFSFGEFVDNGLTPSHPATTKIEALQGHFDPGFRSYDLDYTDVNRAQRFIERWQQFEAEGNLPQFIVMRLPNDHTVGTRVGKPTPTAMVADNDLALGMVVEAISKSKAWPETAIFVVQDDAQNGSDHVDAHRTVALAISPYTRNSGVDSTLYSTASMLRSMELILGLQPMTQFDAAAKPLFNAFSARPVAAPYRALTPDVDLNAINDATAWGADLSETLNLATEDAADDLLFGEIVWRSVRGADSPMPPPVRSAFVFAEVEEDEDREESDSQALPQESDLP